MISMIQKLSVYIQEYSASVADDALLESSKPVLIDDVYVPPMISSLVENTLFDSST